MTAIGALSATLSIFLQVSYGVSWFYLAIVVQMVWFVGVLAKCLAGLLKPTSGLILIKGECIRRDLIHA
ncbi:MAG: hypothetical protein QN229_04335 [Desulfurococcaceae archaeon TW002]